MDYEVSNMNAAAQGHSDLGLNKAPTYYASSVWLLTTPNEFLVGFQRAVPVQQKTNDGILPSGARNEPVATISMSAQVLKDLSLVLADAVRTHEREFGAITTPFTKERATR